MAFNPCYGFYDKLLAFFRFYHFNFSRHIESSGFSIVFNKLVWKIERFVFEQSDQRFPKRVRWRRASGEVIVYLHDFVAWINLIENKGNILVVRDLFFRIMDCGTVEIGFFKAFFERNCIAHCGQPAVDRAVTYGYKDVAVFPERLKDVDIFLVAASAFDEAHCTAFGEFFDVIDRGFVEIDQLDKFQYPVVNVKKRHVTTETSRERRCGYFRFSHD
jgi:hypothetical protein